MTSTLSFNVNDFLPTVAMRKVTYMHIHTMVAISIVNLSCIMDAYTNNIVIGHNEDWSYYRMIPRYESIEVEKGLSESNLYKQMVTIKWWSLKQV